MTGRRDLVDINPLDRLPSPPRTSNPNPYIHTPTSVNVQTRQERPVVPHVTEGPCEGGGWSWYCDTPSRAPVLPVVAQVVWNRDRRTPVTTSSVLTLPVSVYDYAPFVKASGLTRFNVHLLNQEKLHMRCTFKGGQSP